MGSGPARHVQAPRPRDKEAKVTLVQGLSTFWGHFRAKKVRREWVIAAKSELLESRCLHVSGPLGRAASRAREQTAPLL